MFRMLFRRAQATVDHAIHGLIYRAIVAIPFLVAIGFATAALSIRLNREYGPETGSLILAAAFAVLGVIVALIVRVRLEAPTESQAAAEAIPAEPEAAELAGDPSLAGADRELVMAAVTSALPIALPAIVRTIGRNLPLVAAVAAAALIISRDDRGSAANAALEPGE